MNGISEVEKQQKLGTKRKNSNCKKKMSKYGIITWVMFMKQNYRDSKLWSTILVMVIYAIAGAGAGVTYLVLPIEHLLFKFLLCDIVATLIVYLGSCLFRNASVYDPYWSVAPMVMTPLFIHFTVGFHLYTIIILILIELWGARLTLNWFHRFQGLSHQDWRYTHFQTKHPKLWWLISLGGIHLLPTLVVFMAMLPVFSYVNAFYKPVEINGTIIICICVALLGIVLETLADIQMDQFKKHASAKEINRTGLWKKSRHPNYFGEIVFWISMFLFCISVASNMWVMVFSPLFVFLLFGVVSIPMMEKRQLQTKSEYETYKKETNLLLPILAPSKTEDKSKPTSRK